MINLVMTMVFLAFLLTGCGKNASPSSASKTNEPGKKPNQTSLPMIVTPDPVKNPVIIAAVYREDRGLETIVIKNVSEVKQDINGFTLINTITSEHVNILNVTLEPGETFNVYNGVGAKEQKDGLPWLDHPLLNEPGDDVTLLNHAGRVIWTYVYYP